MPLVSICIPAYWNRDTLRRLLSSIRSQDFRDYETIICDDTPGSGLQDVVEPFSDLPGFTYVRNEARLGSPGNWNRCLSLASGEWIKMMHHDDWFASPHGLSEFVRAARESPSAGLVFSSCHAFREGREYVFTHQPFTADGPDAEEKGIMIEDLLYRNQIGCPSVTMFRARSFSGFDENLLWLVDVDAYMSLMQAGGFRFLPEPLINVTCEAGTQITSQIGGDRLIGLRETLYLFDKYRLHRRRGALSRLCSDLDERLPPLPLVQYLLAWRPSVRPDTWGMVFRAYLFHRLTKQVHAGLSGVSRLPALL